MHLSFVSPEFVEQSNGLKNGLNRPCGYRANTSADSSLIRMPKAMQQSLSGASLSYVRSFEVQNFE